MSLWTDETGEGGVETKHTNSSVGKKMATAFINNSQSRELFYMEERQLLT